MDSRSPHMGIEITGKSNSEIPYRGHGSHRRRLDRVNHGKDVVQVFPAGEEGKGGQRKHGTNPLSGKNGRSGRTAFETLQLGEEISGDERSIEVEEKADPRHFLAQGQVLYCLVFDQEARYPSGRSGVRHGLR